MLKTYILTSGKTRSELFGGVDTVKCLLSLKLGKTILDYQLSMLQKFPLDIYIVIGYQGEKIIEYCTSMHYNVKFLWDRTWKKKYATSRIILDNPEFTGPLMIIFGDALFNPDVITWTLKQKADLCIPISSVLKFNGKGIETAKDILANQLDHIGFTVNLFREMEERGLQVKRFAGPIWHSDVDRQEHLKTARDWAKWRDF